MNIARGARYITAADELTRYWERMGSIHAEYGGHEDPLFVLPDQSGPRAEAQIYAQRLQTLFRWPGSVALRLTGIDAAFRVATGTSFPE